MTKKHRSEWHISRRGLGGVALGAALAGASASPTSAREPSTAMLSVEDRLALVDLFANYVWAYDCSDLVEFLSLFTDDAVVVGRGTVYRGKEELARWFNYLLELRENEGDDIWISEPPCDHGVWKAPGRSTRP